MSELLTSLDVVNKAFKKTMRGYDSTEVDEFLDKVAESIQQYTQRTKDFERSLNETNEKLTDYENLKGAIQEALLMAQKTADERVRNAAVMADNIVSEARDRANRLIKEAEANVAERGRELEVLNELRSAGLSNIRSLLGEVADVLDRAESGGRVAIPDFAKKLLQSCDESGDISGDDFDGRKHEHENEPKKQNLSETLNALGLDPKLLLTGMSS